MKELFIKFFRDASAYQSVDPPCFNLTEYTETWLINHKKQLLLHNVVGRSEQLVAFLEFIEGYKMLEVDLEYEEIVRRFLGN